MSGDPRPLPARPPSEVEWEEILVRLEVAARAIRLAVEDSADTPQLNEAVVQAAHAERWWGERLEDLRAGREFSLHAGSDPAPRDGGPLTTPEALDWLVRERGRNFARLQRRGLEVWDWRSDLVEGHALTTYQFVQLRVAADAELIRSIRQLPGS